MVLFTILLYILLSIVIALVAARRVHTSSDFIKAGRHLPMPVILAMVFATWFGTETVLGISATFLDQGLIGLISDPLGASLCLVIYGLFFALPLYRMNMNSIGDYFRIRYNPEIEMIVSICIFASYLGWVAAQISALGLVANVLTDGAVSRSTGIIVGSFVILIYTLLGGMWSIAITTFVQMIIIVIGLLIVTLKASTMAGGLDTVYQSASDAGMLVWLPEFNISSIIVWVGALVTMALGSLPQQDIFQRSNSAKNEKVAVWGTVLGGIFYFLFAAVPLILVYSAKLVDPVLTSNLMQVDSQMVLPVFVLKYMPTWAQILFFGALISVIMSTASATVLAPSVTFSENILRTAMPKMTDRQRLHAIRITVAVFLTVVAGYALATDASIHKMVENAYRVTLSGAFVPLVAGMFWKKASNLGAMLSIIFGLTTWLGLELEGIELLVEPQIIGLLFAIIGMFIGSNITAIQRKKVERAARESL